MSQENVEIVRRAIGWMSQDVADDDARAASVERLAPEAEFVEDPRFPEARTYRGRADVLRYYTDFVSQFEHFVFTVEDIVDSASDDVVVCLHIHGRGKGSSAEFEARAGWIFTVSEGEVVRIRAYLDRAEALAVVEAAGNG
jgi:ketosteroid isomerase-like protein